MNSLNSVVIYFISTPVHPLTYIPLLLLHLLPSVQLSFLSDIISYWSAQSSSPPFLYLYHFHAWLTLLS
jgi:hypothetical protein